jgi:hypothetical protein
MEGCQRNLKGSDARDTSGIHTPGDDTACSFRTFSDLSRQAVHQFSLNSFHLLTDMDSHVSLNIPHFSKSLLEKPFSVIFGFFPGEFA